MKFDTAGRHPRAGAARTREKAHDLDAHAMHATRLEQQDSTPRLLSSYDERGPVQST